MRLISAWGVIHFLRRKTKKFFFRAYDDGSVDSSWGLSLYISTPLLRNGCFFGFSPIASLHPAMLRGTARERLMSGLLLSLFFQPLCHYVPPSPLWLRYTLQCFGARQGRSLKVTLYSYRLSHNNGERRGKFFCEKRLFCYLSSAKRRYKLWGNEYI